MVLEWPLTGRYEELGEVVASLASDSVRGVVIAGAAGVGKTRLAREAVDTLRADGTEVEWVAATYAAAAVPLSVFAHLVPPRSDQHLEPIDVFQTVLPALRQRGGDRDLVLVIDDCQLLDDASAALVLQLATAGGVRLLLTLRSGGRVPDALVALWKDRFVNRIELQPLGVNDTAELLAGVLGGHVDARTAERTWRVTGGNALYVRELVEDLLRTGALCDERGVWRWDGHLAPGARLVELVDARLGRLDDAERLGVELLSIAERLETPVLVDACGTAAVSRLEDDGFITVDRTGRRARAQLVHPMYADILRATMARTRWRELCSRLFSTLHDAGARRAGDVLRLVVWGREAGVDIEPRFLIEAAVHANSLAHRRVAEHLARAALDHGPNATAALALGEALVSQQRVDDAIDVLSGADASAADDATRARIAHWLAMAVLSARDDPDEACTVLADAEASVSERRWADFLRADRASVLAHSGREALAAELVEHLVDDPEADEIVRLRAITPVGLHWVVTGQAGRAAAAARDLVGPALRQHAEVPRGIAWVFHTRATAMLLLGDLDGVQRLVDQLSANLANPEAAPHLALYRGRTLLLQGMPRRAAAALLEADAGLPAPLAEHVWANGLLAEAYAYLGDAATAERHRDEAFKEQRSGTTFVASDVARATAWVSAANGEVSRARESLLALAERCRAANEPGMELHVLHDALRLGARSEVAGRLAEIAGVVDGAWAPLFAAHARALCDDGGAALDAVAAGLEAIGALRVAAEARAEAAVAHRRAGLVARAAASTVAAEHLLSKCDGSVVPALPVADLATATLSRREEEIARLAATGLSNREIAERLYVSVRTVEGHLHRLYAKLGVSDRTDLAPFVASSAGNA